MSSGSFSSSSEPHAIPASSSASDGGRTRKDVLARLHKLQSSALVDPAGVKDKSKIIAELNDICTFLQTENTQLHVKLDGAKTRLDESEEEKRVLVSKLHKTRETLKTFESNQVPLDVRAQQLEDSIGVVEKDIRELDQLNLMGEGKLSRPKNLVTESEEGRVAQLIELKFKRLEELAFVLKKRVAKYEENTSLAGVVKNHGSLPELLKQNTILKQENDMLRLREVRFANKSLLRRRRLTECEPAFLRLLVLALQNELTAHRHVMDKYNFERNPCLGLLVAPPVLDDPDAPREDIDDLFTNGRLKHFGELFTPTEERFPRVGLDPDLEADASQRLIVLQEMNYSLQDQVERLERAQARRHEMAESATEILAEFAGDKAGELNSKERRIVELQRKNEELVEEEHQLLDSLAQKDKTIQMQEQIMRELSLEKEALIDENNAMSDRLLHMKQANQELIAKADKLHENVKVLHRVALSMCLAHIERLGLPERYKKANVAYMFRDLLEVYMRSNTAALRLQAFFRGVMARKRLGIATADAMRKAVGRKAAAGDGADAEQAVDAEKITLYGLPQADGSIAHSGTPFTFLYTPASTDGDNEYVATLAVQMQPVAGDESDADAATPRVEPAQPEAYAWLQELMGRLKMPLNEESAGEWCDFEPDEAYVVVPSRSPSQASSAGGDEDGAASAAGSGSAASAAGDAAAETGDASGDATADADATSDAADVDADADADAAGSAASSPAPSSAGAQPPARTQHVEALAAQLRQFAKEKGSPVEERDFLPAFFALSEILSTVDVERERVTKMPYLVQIAKHELLEVLKPAIAQEMSEMKMYMHGKVEAIEKATSAVLLKPTVSRTSQTRVPLADSSAQTEDEDADDGRKAKPKAGKRK